MGIVYRLTFTAVLCAGAALVAAPASKWIQLFDGKSFKNWVDPRKKTPPGDAWTIESGTIKTLKNPKLTEDLFSTRTFGDFEFSFEWKISPGGNSGIKYRIQDHLWLQPTQRGERFEASVERSFAQRTDQRPERGQDYVIGFEYQITDDAENRDAKSNPSHAAGALYDMVVPSQAAAKPAGEWNQGRIVVRGKRAEHWLNGIKVVDVLLDDPAIMAAVQRRWTVAPHVHELLTKQPKSDTPISLQNHGDDAWFRNLRIRELK
jgi:hypothetical protein